MLPPSPAGLVDSYTLDYMVVLERVWAWHRFQPYMWFQFIAIEEESYETARKLFEDVEMRLLVFQEYGKGFIKKSKVSPDGYIQMALQLANYRVGLFSNNVGDKLCMASQGELPINSLRGYDPNPIFLKFTLSIVCVWKDKMKELSKIKPFNREGVRVDILFSPGPDL